MMMELGSGLLWGGFGLLRIAFSWGQEYGVISPKPHPGGDGLATQSRRGSLYHYITQVNRTQHNYTKQGEKVMLNREEMIEYITERVQEADDIKLEQYYWFFQFEEE